MLNKVKTGTEGQVPRGCSHVECESRLHRNGAEATEGQGGESRRRSRDRLPTAMKKLERLSVQHGLWLTSAPCALEMASVFFRLAVLIISQRTCT
jgi:hypothetical protein